MGFYRRWYAPKNASLIVVGAFSTEKMLREIKKRFRDFRGGAIPRIFFPREPAGRRAGVVLEKNPVEAAYFSIGFHIPGITDRDIPSIDMLSHILGGSESSRLPQSVKEKKRLVNDVQSHAFTPRHPGLFMVSGVTTPEKIEGAVMAVWDEILRLRREPASLREIERSRLNLCSSEIYEKETAGGQAGKYAYFLATAGSHDFEKEYYRALHDVRAEDILCAARRYLSPSNATAVIIHPSGALRRVNAKKIKRHIGIRERACLPAARAWKRAPEPVVHTLQNGVRLVIRENHALPIASLTAVMLGGLRFESRRMNGVNNLLALTITKGTSGMTAVEVAEKIESVAGTVHGFAGRNSFGVKTEFLSDKFDAGFGLFGEILREPGFAASEVQKEKLQVLDAIRQQEDSLSSLAFMEFLAALFPKHPYGLRMLGERDSVKALTRERLAGYYRRIADPREMVISVVGDVSPEDVLKLSEANFRFARGGGRKPPKPEAGLRHTSPVTVERRKKGKEQAHIVTGFLGPRLASKDHYAMIVLNNVLTGQGGRLFLRLRDEMGLAYAVNSTYFAGLEPGFIAIYIGTEPKKVEKALAGIRSELEKIIRKGVGRSELDRSKNYIVGSFELDKQRNSNMADSYAFNLLYGLGISESEKFPEKIRRVGSDDILRVAEKYIALDAPVTAIIRP
jgi:zinc protease